MVNPKKWKKESYEGPVTHHIYYNDELVHTFMTDGDEESIKKILDINNFPYDTIKKLPA